MGESITQDMAYRQPLMRCVEKHGVKQAGRRYSKSRSYLCFWRACWDGTVESLSPAALPPGSLSDMFDNLYF